MSNSAESKPNDADSRSTPDDTDRPVGSSDRSIGRPGPWREGRYEQPGKPVDRSVLTPGGDAAASSDPVSTPVTREDYEGKSDAKGRR
ncbi:MAG TPA: hypothetical protein VHV81_11470 [Steroidobacteraceae bacterium]|jgi:hypothetical protein|nr:hypothetical protein [Steroidobacteraceae bacterium]